MAKETTLQTREQIIELKKSGLTISHIATKLDLSVSCVRKFFRRFRDLGKQGLERLSRRPKKAPLTQVPERTRKVILETKRKHLKWGAQFIQGELDRRKFKEIPHRRTIERFLHQYPEFPWQTHRKREVIQDASRATRLHQLWQMDFIVERKLNGTEQKYSFLQIRDMASTQSILKYTLPAKRSALTSQEMIPVCRQAFRKTGHLPEAIRTDHGSCFVGPEKASFPSDFTLFLWGLGIEHELIPVKCPAKNGGIERDQRTFGEHFLEDYQFSSHERLEQDAEAFGAFQNKHVPSRSVRCRGRTADETAAQLKCRAQSYKLAQEARMFSVARIYDKLAQLRWPRMVSTNGYVHLGHYPYYVGWAYKAKEVEVRLDRQSKELVICSADKVEIKRWPIRGISYREIVKEPAFSPSTKRWGRKPKP
jgi:transposase InsO family protein